MKNEIKKALENPALHPVDAIEQLIEDKTEKYINIIVFLCIAILLLITILVQCLTLHK